MPTDIVPAPAVAYGGRSVYQGDPSPRALSGADFSSVQAGGVDWVGDGARCSYTTKSGRACQANPLEGLDICIGHQRQAAANER